MISKRDNTHFISVNCFTLKMSNKKKNYNLKKQYCLEKSFQI